MNTPAMNTTSMNTPAKKRGRPPLFDELKRTELCAMVRSGCSIRYAAHRLGVNRSTIRYACRTDPAFADRLRDAEHERSQSAIGRVFNAGEHSWRAAAWLLERNDPVEFSLRRRNRDPWKYLGKRRLKQLITDVVQEVVIDCLKSAGR
jgi:hypothetical protein